MPVLQGVVKSIGPEELTLSNGEVLPYGLCVWSTGVGPTDFTTSLPFAKSAKGRIAVDDALRVLVHPSDAETGPSTPSEVLVAPNWEQFWGIRLYGWLRQATVLLCCISQEQESPCSLST